MPAPVRVVVRGASKLPHDLRRGVDVVEGSHGDAAVIDAALDGADGLFWLVPPNLPIRDLAPFLPLAKRFRRVENRFNPASHTIRRFRLL